MDFEKLLKFASQEQKSREEKPLPKKYSTSLGPAKREAPKPKGVQSAAVKAFLEKKEKEEQERLAAERKKKQGLIEARREANTLRKAEKIYKRSKEHAVDLELEDNGKTPTKRREDGGAAKAKSPGEEPEDMPVQFKKNNIRIAATGMSTSEKYRLAQEKARKIKDMQRDREKQAIVDKSKALSAEIAKTPKDSHSSKAKLKSEAVHVQKPSVGVSVPVKNKSNFQVKKKSEKPPLSFEELIKLAQQKKSGEDTDAKEKKKKNPNSRPLTQEEKERQERKKSKEYREWYLHGGKHYGDQKSDSPQPEKKDSNKKPSSQTTERKNGMQKIMKDTNSKGKGSSVSNGNGAKPSANNRLDQRVPNMPSGRGTAGIQGKNMKTPQKLSSSQSKKYAETHNNVLTCGPADGASESEEEEPQLSVWDRINRENQKYRPKQEKRKRPGVIDSESEYDEEMDDFIDEDDDDDDFIDDSEAVDVSSQIREIFGYDRRKFKYETDDDLRGMESSFSSQMQEEARSARIAIKEDLEEQKKEEEHARRKLMMKKNKKFKR